MMIIKLEKYNAIKSGIRNDIFEKYMMNSITRKMGVINKMPMITFDNWDMYKSIPPNGIFSIIYLDTILENKRMSLLQMEMTFFWL